MRYALNNPDQLTVVTIGIIVFAQNRCQGGNKPCNFGWLAMASFPDGELTLAQLFPLAGWPPPPMWRKPRESFNMCMACICYNLHWCLSYFWHYKYFIAARIVHFRTVYNLSPIIFHRLQLVIHSVMQNENNWFKLDILQSYWLKAVPTGVWMKLFTLVLAIKPVHACAHVSKIKINWTKHIFNRF